MQHQLSHQAWQKAQAALAGGVNSPVRSFRSVGGTPIFIRSASGSQLTDIDGNHYLDYVASWGPAILGHAHPEVTHALGQQLTQGLSFGTPTELETDLANTIKSCLPSIELIRMVNSGTEACMSAIRLARGYTGRKKIVTFAGCYHGHGDSFLGNAGSGLLDLGICDAVGVVPELTQHTLSLPYNDVDCLNEVCQRYGSSIAAIIVEPVAANMNLILPRTGFLNTVIQRARAIGALSIFDEVMTGFRVHSGGAQGLYNLQPDLTTLGKAIGGGLPVGAYGGRADIMEKLAPTGSVYQAGTLSGNPLAMRAGLETLRLFLAHQSDYHQACRLTERLVAELNRVAQIHQINLQARAIGTMFGLHFLPDAAHDLNTIERDEHRQLYRAVFHAMLERGIYLAPSPFEVGFMSFAHRDNDVERTIDCFEQSCRFVAESNGR